MATDSFERERTGVWLDCDPGHDDAFAIILAGHSPALRLLGVSTVHGNSPVSNTTKNALSILHAAGLSHVPVVAGAAKPLVRPGKACPDIHGDSGLDVAPGGTGLPPLPPDVLPVSSKAIAFTAATLERYYNADGRKAVLVATGPLTNVALLVSVYPGVIPMIDIVLMGGAIGMGNTRPSSEFNIELDPEAAHIVFNCGASVTMVPLEVTHTALATSAVLDRVAWGGTRVSTDECAMPGLNEAVETAVHTSTAAGTAQATRSPPSHSKASLSPALLVQELGGPTAAELALVPEGGPVDTALVPAGTGHAAGQSSPAASPSGKTSTALAVPEMPGATPFRKLCGSLLRFFAGTYRSVFFMAAPPLHDPCAVFYVIAHIAKASAASSSSASTVLNGHTTSAADTQPGGPFKSQLCRVDVEMSSPLTYGRTVVDLYNVTGRLGIAPSGNGNEASHGPNVNVCLSMDVPAFWGAMLEAIAAADAASPMNRTSGGGVPGGHVPAVGSSALVRTSSGAASAPGSLTNRENQTDDPAAVAKALWASAVAERSGSRPVPQAAAVPGAGLTLAQLTARSPARPGLQSSWSGSDAGSPSVSGFAVGFSPAKL